MLQSIRFSNFKMLRDATLPLGRFTLIVGPNGSGKSTAMLAFRTAAAPSLDVQRFVTKGLPSENAVIEIELHWHKPYEGVFMQVRWHSGTNSRKLTWGGPTATSLSSEIHLQLERKIERSRVYALNANAIAADVSLQPHMELQENGGFLAGVLDRLRDEDPERFEVLNPAISKDAKWIPDISQIFSPDVS